ncbi:MAG TPA: molybdopterin-dependent oxidoreductase [Gordonibacter urolithinfaciens]|uniref:molybdopterin-containing oxidoreductase family protein n=1 Tax=Gordonibacter TaxID=644652 RepID=UPI001D471A81|nr:MULTISPECIES: molybdopterin-dependent oxidoreductase [Gordonibacter]MDN4508433.1 molybdopterin-dependent oxidoreductase [Gordonibacter sp. RACS_AR49]HJF61904.1 molybdopterin-dependent oxidoreductase [Gordonibacter urolithinfaciens]
MAVKTTRTVCVTCHARCGAIVHSEDGKIVKVEGDPKNPRSKGVFCGSGLSQREIHNNTEGRILYPMKRSDWDPKGERHPENRGKSAFERISWDEALDIIADECFRIKEAYGPEAIITGQGTGRTWNHWHCRINSSLGLEGWSLAPTHVCLMPLMLPNAFTLGIFSDCDGDLANASTIVHWGCSPATQRSRTKMILDRIEAGLTKYVVIDVRYTDLAKNAEFFLQPRPGTDSALALGFMNVIIRENLYDEEWVSCWTYGFDELAERVAQFPPERVEAITGVAADDIAGCARLLATNGPVAFQAVLGPGCMHTNAIQSGRAVACLQGLLGHLDVPGGVPINVAFSAMLDDRITLWDPAKDPGRADLFTFGGEDYPLYKVFGRSNAPASVFEAAITGEPRPVKMMVFVANDPLLCYENATRVHEAITSPLVDTIVSKDFYFSPTTKLADLVLPTADWSERDTVDEELFGNLVISTERAVEPPGECWDDWKFFLEWGKRIKPEDWPWADEREMVLWRLKEFYGMDLTWDEYVQGAYFPLDDGSGSDGPVYKKYEKGMIRPDGQPGFNTPTGRIEFWCDALARFGYDPLPDYTEPAETPVSQPELAKEYPLILVTGHRLYAFFHSAWTNIPAQRELYPHPFVLIHPDDAAVQGIIEGDWVTVESPRGHIVSKAHVTHEILKGVLAAPRHGWRDECPELGLPGYGWDKANPNVLVPSRPAEPRWGATAMRSTLCRVKKGADING